MGSMFLFPRPTEFQKPGYRVNGQPSRGPPQSSERPVWLQRRNVVLQRTEDRELILISSDLSYKYKTCSVHNSNKYCVL